MDVGEPADILHIQTMPSPYMDFACSSLHLRGGWCLLSDLLQQNRRLSTRARRRKSVHNFLIAARTPTFAQRALELVAAF
ncbi:hypothetical protein CU100_17945 [Phyllobacterium endophyticum]|uniref:Uncharacterized protein n=1 Tax=Phyllobacterium endophyticum TaxID=1149773 RepID=A0A2P7ASE5_9HYPH|nr:hypothetical protein CU100_17945 [Phyllobacterium endophyticum]